jgi:hypothetical protein
MKKLAIIILIFFICSCRDERNLGDNYFYLPMYEAKDIGHKGSFIYTSHYKNVFSNIIIESNVIDINVNKDFILAVQKLDTGNLEVRADIIIDTELEEKDLRYFIIVKFTGSIYGPYSKEKYLLKRNELNIPKELKLGLKYTFNY